MSIGHVGRRNAYWLAVSQWEIKQLFMQHLFDLTWMTLTHTQHSRLRMTQTYLVRTWLKHIIIGQRVLINSLPEVLTYLYLTRRTILPLSLVNLGTVYFQMKASLLYKPFTSLKLQQWCNDTNCDSFGFPIALALQASRLDKKLKWCFIRDWGETWLPYFR